MKRLAIVMALICVVAFIACNSNTDAPKTDAPKNASLSDAELVKRGEYLVGISGCNDCHSPKKPGAQGPELIPELMLSGHAPNSPTPKADKSLASQGFAVFAPDLTAVAGPWGTSFSANLTPDSTTGIGGWTEDQFKIAITQGKYKGQAGGRMLLPPMPWPSYAKMADEDIKAIFAYLKSIKPVKNAVPLPIAPDKM